MKTLKSGQQMSKGTFKTRITGFINELINPATYMDWVNKNTTLQGIPFTCDRYPFQEAILNDMTRELHVIKPSQIGLALDLNIPIPTPTGWTTMGEVQVGDLIYAPDGNTTKVTFKSEVYLKHKCYELTFSDGTTIVADENHKWKVSNVKAFCQKGMYQQTGRLSKNSEYATTNVVNTAFLFQQYSSGLLKNNFFIPTTEPLTGFGELPLNPYFLGLWLGDGHSYSSNLTSHYIDTNELVHELEKRGFFCRVTTDGENTHTIKPELESGTTYSKLSELNLLKNKHIPTKYLRADVESRLELLRGLIDTDGSISTQTGRVSFYNCSKQLIADVHELVVSLGFKPKVRWRKPTTTVLKNGQKIVGKQDKAEISFLAYADQQMAYLTRKVKNQKKTGRVSETKRRFIVSVKAVDSVPVQCLTVDHPEHLFLCSKAMIATHNTEVQLRKALAFVHRNPYRNLIYTMPDKDMRKRVYQNRVLPILTNDPIFHELNAEGKKPIRSIEVTEVGTSQMLMFPANEKAATSQPADAVFNDEVDLSDSSVIALFNSRLQGSDLKLNHNYSTPTYDGMGISALYETSDQKEYLFKCPHCGYYQMPEFTTKYVRIKGLPMEADDDLSKFDPLWVDKYNINFADAYSVCFKCGKPVTYGAKENHQWVAKHPHRQIGGYRVSPFSTKNLDAQYILETLIKYVQLDNMKGFKNTVLGLTHETPDERLSESLLKTLFMNHKREVDFENPTTEIPHFIGIDMGTVCNIVVSKAISVSRVEKVLFETIKKDLLLERVKFLFEKFNIVGGHIDRLPLITDSEAIRDWSDKRVMPIQYEQQKGSPIVLKEDEYGSPSYLAVNRTFHIDCFANAIRAGYITFGGYGNQKETIIQHLRAMVRVTVEDKIGLEKTPIWKKIDKKDHYFHACAYNYQAVLQYYQGYAYDVSQGESRSVILLGSMETNLLVPENSFSLLGGR